MAGGSWSGWGGSSSSSWNNGFSSLTPIKPVKVASHDHGILHNLLTDVRDAGVGFFPGLLKTGEAVASASVGNFKPIEHIGAGIAHSYGSTYGPLFHGDFHTFAQRVKNHPLQPLLDALTVPTLGAGAVGSAVRGADMASQGLKLGSEASRAALTLKANKFRPGVQEVNVGAKFGPTAYRSISGNPFTRWRQGKFQQGGTALSRAGSSMLIKNPESRLGKTLQDNYFGDLHFQKKFNAMDRSSREVATATMFKRTMKAAKILFKEDSLAPEDIAKLLDPHIRQGAVDLAREVTHDQLVRKGKAIRPPDGWAFLHHKGGYLEFPHDKTPQEFSKWIQSYGKRLITNRHGQAMKRGDKYLLVRRRNLDDYIREANNSYSFLHTAAKFPTKLWKWSILATSPRYLVNNVFGNHLMYMMSANPVSTIRGMHDAIKDIHGNHVALKGLSEIDKAQRAITGDWIDKHYLGTTQGFSHEQMKDIGIGRRGVNALKQGFYPITHHLSDTLVRRAAINYIIRRHPLYQEFYREARKTLDPHAAHRLAGETVSSEPSVRAYVTKNVDNVLGQYHHFNNAERATKNIVPFYSWDRAIMRHALTMASDRPYQAAAMYQIGRQGMDEVQKWLGPVPNFLKGAIPLEMLGLHGAENGVAGLVLGQQHVGRKKVLTTQGLNPYSTIPDVTDALGSLVKGNPQFGEALASQINPFYTGAVQHYTGQSVISGARVPKHGGLIPDVLRNVAESTPLVKMGNVALNGRPLPKVDARTGKTHAPLLYRGDLGQQVRSWVGLPIKDFSTKTALNLHNKEQGIHKPTPPKIASFNGWKKGTHRITSTRKTSRYRYRVHAKKYTVHMPKPKKYI